MATPAVDKPNNQKAFVDAPNAPSFPVVIDATHNEVNFNSVPYLIDQYRSRRQGTALTLPVTIDDTHKSFNYNAQVYTLPLGVYKTASALAKAVNASIQTGDASRFDTLVNVSANTNATLRFDSLAKVSLLVFATGSSNDCIVRLGVANSNAMAAVGYPDLVSLKNAVNAALLVSDGVTRLDAAVTATVSPYVPTKLRFTNNAQGVVTTTFATGTSNSATTLTGLANGTALALGATARTATAFAANLTTNQTPAAHVAVAGNPDDIVSVVAGTGVTVTSTDPHNPIVAIAVPSDAADTVAGSNGVLSSSLTWVKSTDASVIVQLVEMIANSGGAVLASAYVSPGTQALAITTTAVAQKARVTAINGGGSLASTLSSTITPTGS